MISNYRGEIMLKRITEMRSFVMRSVKDEFFKIYDCIGNDPEAWVLSIANVKNMDYRQVEIAYTVLKNEPGLVRRYMVLEGK